MRLRNANLVGLWLRHAVYSPYDKISFMQHGVHVGERSKKKNSAAPRSFNVGGSSFMMSIDPCLGRKCC